MTKEQDNKKPTQKDDDELAIAMAHLRFGASVIRAYRKAKEEGTATPFLIRGTTSGETVEEKKSNP